jgi:hypothetical protein
MGNRLSNLRFNVSVNPNGILFNPVAISNCLSAAINQSQANEDHIISRDGLFFSYDHHSSFHSESRTELADKISKTNNTTLTQLTSCDYLFITFGTAFVYTLRGREHTVANCHKQPSSTFSKRLLEPEEIVNIYSDLIHELAQINPDLQIIFTVSPVKHLRDGVEQNSLSKSTSILAVHKLVARFNRCSYFPAFELVNDDLRDHRFYEKDLAHPTEVAIDYVWDKFIDCYFSDETKALNGQIEKLNLAEAHKPLFHTKDPDAALQEFILKQKEEINKRDPAFR